ncbi:RNA 2'-phosphotransferase [Halostella sp. JP-L12]|uniref:RNA 2'-phosphotransferase n=1 Tax=Halostella TaxID=1843185 RepID=UPI000EF7E457|nr:MULTISPECIES: RNA 2'-phosphotransferase [Halostella]NHN47275.1 RNA 2'-phosphotransferase [Halostella sp. JP-L12]
MSGVRDCEAHGFFAGGECPVCGDGGRRVLSDRRRTRLSKFLSGALRHFPSDAGLSLDDAGWTPYADLVDAVTGKYDWADEKSVAGVVATDPKGRFERDGDRVRAAYGHSVDVSLEPTDAPVPDELYHGTAPENVESILAEGLKPMRWQKVHLSASTAGARSVGERHAPDPVVLRVDAAAMLADGRRVTKRGRDTYTTDCVPAEYLTATDG